MAIYKTIVLIPIHKEIFSNNETLAIKHSISILQLHDQYFVCPKRLNVEFYRRIFPNCGFKKFDDAYFISIRAYSKLLMSQIFYKSFMEYTHVLIIQPDAIVFRDDLNFWMDSPFDYIGAPWVNTWEITFPYFNTPFDGVKFYVNVGNGGLSLRRVSAMLQVLDELHWLIKKYHEFDEDAFFSLAGHLSSHFLVPNIVRAAQFSMECEPRRYMSMTNCLPMGTHAWERWDKPFWINIFREIGLVGFG